MSVFRKLLLKDYVTLAGTVTGTLTIILALLGVFYNDSFYILAGTMSWGVAMSADLFDGWVARKLNQVNQIGKEIDSLSDAVSFVVAPSMIILCAGLTGEFESFSFPVEILIIGVIVFVFCGIIRLAWFNVEDKGVGYTGLVTPMSAAFLITFFLTHYHFNRLDTGWHAYHQLLNPLAIFFGNIFTIIFYMILLGILNLAPFLRYSGAMQKKRGTWVYILMTIGIFILVMIILASIFSGMSTNIAVFVGHIFGLGFLFCVIAYIAHGFITYVSLKRKGEL